MENGDEKKHGRLEWMFYMILLPLLFTAILTGILLWFIGYDVKGILQNWGNSIPYVEKIVPGASPDAQKAAPAAPAVDEMEIWKKKNAELNLKLKEQQQDQEKLKKAVEEQDGKVQQLQQENEQLKQMVEEEKEKKQQQEEKRKEMAELYTAMSPSKAAPILEQLPIPQTVEILKSMGTEERGAVLAKIDPVIAAKITTELLKEE